MTSSISMSYYSARIDEQSRSIEEYRSPKSLTSSGVTSIQTSSHYTMAQSEDHVRHANTAVKIQNIEVSSEDGSSGWSDGEEGNSEIIGNMNMSFGTDGSELDFDDTDNSENLSTNLKEKIENMKQKTECTKMAQAKDSEPVESAKKSIASVRETTDTEEFHSIVGSLEIKGNNEAQNIVSQSDVSIRETTDTEEFQSIDCSLVSHEKISSETEQQNDIDDTGYKTIDMSNTDTKRDLSHNSNDDENLKINNTIPSISLVKDEEYPNNDVTMRKSNAMYNLHTKPPSLPKPAFEIIKNVNIDSPGRSSYQSIMQRCNKTSISSNDDIYLPDDDETERNLELCDIEGLDFASATYESERFKTFSANEHEELSIKSMTKTQDAYKSWLSAKRTQIASENARRKRMDERLKKKEELRKKRAQLHYDKWLKAKSETSMKKKNPKETMSDTKIQKNGITAEEAKQKVDAWKKQKKLEDDKKRAEKEKEEELKQQELEERRQKASKAWKNWIKEAPKKPKPVPLNQGLLTLRGTISQIHLNDKEWVNP